MDVQFLSTLMLCVAIVLVLLLILVLASMFWKKLCEMHTLIYGKTVHFDPSVDKLVDFAVDCWRLKNNVEKMKPQLTPEDVKRLDNSMRRIDSFLRNNDIEIEDYTGRSANDGINAEVIAVEHDPSLKKPIIKETVVPAIKYKGNLRKKSQIIILDNSKEKEQ